MGIQKLFKKWIVKGPVIKGCKRGYVLIPLEALDDLCEQIKTELSDDESDGYDIDPEFVVRF